jgi:hypothetical protein
MDEIVIPENEKWMHEEPYKSRIDRALEWAAQREPQATDLDELEARLIAHWAKREQEDAQNSSTLEKHED